ncbi:MAG: hypothetical protein VKJ06_00750 [Vampirovibrionales bacterium]|nr:hypothetical protein [Vampirovibrionales bacterium]
MDYAIQLLIPVFGALALGIWLSQNHWISPVLVPFLPVLGLALGIGVVAKKLLLQTPPKKILSPKKFKKKFDDHPSDPYALLGNETINSDNENTPNA